MGREARAGERGAEKNCAHSANVVIETGHMARFYQRCRYCGHTRMQLLGKSEETFGSPPTATLRYYRCPHCKRYQTYNVERNLLMPGVPQEFKAE